MLPVENLSGDSSLDWAGGALAQAVVEQLTGTIAILPIRVDSISDAYGVHAARALEAYLSRENGRLRISLTVEDLNTNRAAQSAAASADGVLPLAETIARQLASNARPLGTSNETAFQNFAAGRYEDAVKADANFGAAYVYWARDLVSRGRADEALRVAGLARGREVRPIDKARLDVLAATLKGDATARLNALAELAKVIPSDADVLRSLGEAALHARRFSASADWFRKAAQVDPSNGVYWNSLGYSLAYARDLKGALVAIEQYQKVAPDRVNPLDSRGEIYFYFGRFADAEKAFLSAYEKNRGFLGGAELLKAAHARMMQGDLARADELFGNFIEANKDSMAEYRRARWEYITGRKRQAVQRLAQFAGHASGDAAAFAPAELSGWSLNEGARERAAQMAERAQAAAQSPAAKSFAALCRFVSQPSAPASEWALRGERAFPGPNAAMFKSYAIAYALLFDKRFAEAAVQLRQIFERTPPETDGQVKVLLGWALVESGKEPEARDMLETWPIPRSQGEPAFEFLVLPRIFELRAIVLDKRGQAAEAKEMRRIWDRYRAE